MRLPRIVAKLCRDAIDVLAVAVDDHHIHVFAQFPDHQPRKWIGRAKMHSSMLLREHGLCGQVWARGSRVLPVRDRAHQLNVLRLRLGGGYYALTPLETMLNLRVLGRY